MRTNEKREKIADTISFTKEERVAMAFVDRYPLTTFLSDRLDGTGPTVQRGTEIRVVYVGFGEINKRLLFASDVTERFFVQEGKILRFLPVKRYVFGATGEDEAFTYDRMLEAFRARQEEFLPLPPPPSEVHFSEKRPGDEGFSEELRAAMGKDAYVRVIFATGDEDGDARESAALAKETAGGKTEVFAYAKQAKEGAIAFGYEKEDRWYEQAAEAKRRGYERARKTSPQDEMRVKSNVYAALSLRSKLAFLGFDVAGKDDERPDGAEEYRKTYVGSVREAYGEHEHDRWNAYTFRCGFVPATKEETTTKTAEELRAERKHANLTTYEGLRTYAKMMAKKNGSTEEEEDVVRYDYALMDEAIRLAQAGGKKIVRRQ